MTRQWQVWDALAQLGASNCAAVALYLKLPSQIVSNCLYTMQTDRHVLFIGYKNGKKVYEADPANPPSMEGAYGTTKCKIKRDRVIPPELSAIISQPLVRL